MNELFLEWMEAGQVKSYVIRPDSATRQSKPVYVGRDPNRCDLVLEHPTVSGLHVEIFFDDLRQGFFLKNLRDSNPPIVNGEKLTQGEVQLQPGNQILLGQQEIQVTRVMLEVPQIPPTRLIMSPEEKPESVPSTPDVQTSDQTYGLQCSRCRQISPYDRLELGCIWCGTSLAAAVSVLILKPDSET